MPKGILPSLKALKREVSCLSWTIQEEGSWGQPVAGSLGGTSFGGLSDREFSGTHCGWEGVLIAIAEKDALGFS